MRVNPKEFVEAMDKQIIGQDRAKKIIAIALRNRWRMTQLEKKDRSSITPKNILMIGPTGVGKTALIKAVAGVIDAPFLKVEATKYTQVGYVGDTVNEMIHNLADEADRLLNKGSKISSSMSPTFKRPPTDSILNFTTFFDYCGDNIFDVYGTSNNRTYNPLYSKILSILRKEMYAIVVKTNYPFQPLHVFTNTKGFYTPIDMKKEELVPKPLIKKRISAFDTFDFFLVYKGFVPKIALRELRGSVRKERTDEYSKILKKAAAESEIIVNLAKYIDTGERGYIDKFVIAIKPRLSKKLGKELENTSRDYFSEFGYFNNKKTPSSNNNKHIVKDNSVIDLVHSKGIIFIDEIDKLADKSVQKDNVGKVGVQRDLLSLLDDTEIETKYGIISTKHIMFIAAGAFHATAVSDLMPELLGRLPIKIYLEPMSRNVLERIVKDERLSPVSDFKKLMATEGVKLEITDDALNELARIANVVNNSYGNMGARTLFMVTNRIFEDIAFADHETDDNVSTIFQIDLKYVKERGKGIIKEFNGDFIQKLLTSNT